MSIARHILLWIQIFFIGIFLVPMVLPPESAQGRIMKELEASRRVFGVELTDVVVARANAVHEALIINTGLQGIVERRYTTEDDVRAVPLAQSTQSNIGSAFNRYLHSALIQTYGLFLRLNILTQWMVYVGVFVLAVVVDGWTQRQKKFASGQDIETVAFALGGHTVVFATGLPFIYLIYPFYFSPWFMPLWVLLVAGPMTLAIRNMAGLR